jgi:manganese transport protein
MKNKILKALSLIGPGLFLIGYNIGTGSVTTMAKTGAEHGMSLFWALVLSAYFTYLLMVAYGKVTLVSGKTALNFIKTELKGGWLLAIYIFVALVIGELLALMGVMGIVADLTQEGLSLIFGTKVSRFSIILVYAFLIILLLKYGNYQSFEKVLTFFVIIMALCFIGVLFMVKPDFQVILQGLIPSLPKTSGAMGLIAAIAGTTCSAAVFIMRSTVIKEKGWTIDDLPRDKIDSAVSSGMMLVLSGVIMAVGAGTLYVMKISLQNTLDMVHLFEPLGGKWAALVLIFGIVGAGLSTVFPIVLIAPWLWADYREQPRNIQSTTSQWMIAVALLFAFGSVFLSQRPPALMIFSQAFQACILPAVAIPIFILWNRAGLMKAHKATKAENIGMVLVIIFSLVTTYFALAEVL